MTDQVLTIGFVVMFFGGCGAAFAIWRRIENIVKNAKDEAIASFAEFKQEIRREIEKIKTDQGTIQQSMGMATQLFGSQLQDMRVMMAEQYVRRDGLKDLKEEFAVDMTELKGSIAVINGRLDRFSDIVAKVARRNESETN